MTALSLTGIEKHCVIVSFNCVQNGLNLIMLKRRITKSALENKPIKLCSLHVARVSIWEIQIQFNSKKQSPFKSNLKHNEMKIDF